MRSLDTSDTYDPIEVSLLFIPLMWVDKGNVLTMLSLRPSAVQHDACLDQFHGIQGFPSSEGADVRRVSIRMILFLLHPVFTLV